MYNYMTDKLYGDKRGGSHYNPPTEKQTGIIANINRVLKKNFQPENSKEAYDIISNWYPIMIKKLRNK